MGKREDDAPREDDSDRYAIYVVRTRTKPGEREHHRLATGSLNDVGPSIVWLRASGELHQDDRVGIFDRRERKWVLNPWAPGR